MDIQQTLEAIFDSPLGDGEDYGHWRTRVIKDIRRALANQVQQSCCHVIEDSITCLPCWSAGVIVRGGSD
jgi:hypothetical protein